MAFSWSRNKYSPIAIDFGADSLKLLQVAPDTGHAAPQMIAAATATVPDEARHDAKVRQRFYADSLQQLIKSNPFQGKRAVCATTGHQTLVQHLQLCPGEGVDIELQIADELRQRLNVDPSRMVVRHFEVGTFVREGAPRQEVICVAAGREVVMQQIQMAGQAGLEIVGMSCEAQAVLQSFAHLYRRASDVERATCFIDMGATTVKAVIAHGTTMVCAKTMGIKHPSHESNENGEGPGEPGEAREAGGADFRPARTGAPGLAVLEAAAPAPTRDDDDLECLVDQLQLCLRYHQSMFPDHKVEKIVFLGGGSHNVSRCQAIAKALHISAQLGDPLARLARSNASTPPDGLDMRQPQPGWAVPMGLCLCHP